MRQLEGISYEYILEHMACLSIPNAKKNEQMLNKNIITFWRMSGFKIETLALFFRNIWIAFSSSYIDICSSTWFLLFDWHILTILQTILWLRCVHMLHIVRCDCTNMKWEMRWNYKVEKRSSSKCEMIDCFSENEEYYVVIVAVLWKLRFRCISFPSF